MRWATSVIEDPGPSGVEDQFILPGMSVTK